MAVAYYNNFDGAMLFSDVAVRMTLTTSTELTFTVPGDNSDKYRAEFTYASDSNIFVGLNTTAAVPADDTVISSGSVEFKPDVKLVKGGDVLHFITPDTKEYVGVSFSQVPA